jgi:hypothetical protein
MTIKNMKTTCITISLALFTGLTACTAETLAANPDPASTTPAAQSPPPRSTRPSSRFGAGVVIGEPTGVSAKYWLSDVVALDGMLGFRLSDTDDVFLNADVLWHNYDLIPVSTGRAAAYLGVGPSILFRDEEDNRFGIRVPVGVSYKFNNQPLDVFLEVAPIVDVAPVVRGDFNVGIGVRFWF